MKNIHGIWLPGTDTHFDNMISVGNDAVAGKGTYQLKKYRAALGYVKGRDLAIDIGGHVGLWSRVMSYDFNQVVAFEPLQAHRDCFNRNMHEDNRQNVTLFPYALSDRSGTLAIHMPTDNTGHAHVSASGEVVQAVTLDSIKVAGRIDFVKIDVEGWELAVLRGAEKTLKEHRPTIVIEQKPHGNAERYGWAQHDAVKLLRKWGWVEKAMISGDHILTGA
jgi:FkbM family methyltransferase